MLHHHGLLDKLLSVFRDPIDKDTIRKYIVKLDTGTGDYGDFVNVKISTKRDIAVENDVPVILYGSGSSAYIKGPPREIVIDGAFGDWAGIDNHPDETNEDTVDGNPNIDITEYRSMVMEEADPIRSSVSNLCRSSTPATGQLS